MTIDTKAESSAGTPEQAPISEKGKPNRVDDEISVRIFEAWLSTLDSRVESEELKPHQRNKRIALAMLRKEKKYKNEKEKNKYDPLTGLRRQEHLIPKLEKMIAEGAPFAVLFTDLDDFTRVNDDYGHPVGNEIIAQAALRIQEGLRDDTSSSREEDETFIGDPFRNGGDETVIVLPGVNNQNDLRNIGNRLRTLINDNPFTVPNNEDTLSVTVSIGGVLWDGDQQAAEFLGTVDSYLYKAKENRGSLEIK